MNLTAAIIAGIYCLITSGIALDTVLRPPTGFASASGLKHMLTFFATAPISVPLSILGMEPNFNRPSTVVLVILAATAVVYGLVALITWIFGKF
ncbi:MAG: hypothetical protein NTV52_29545 [Acidobacteria bacterium]|nr:hypothetical protein [Acidobacteriota bacterium]